MSPIEFYYAMEEYSERKMVDARVIYESMRLQTYFLIDIQLSKGHKLKGVTKLMKFPWDIENKPQEVKKQSMEEMKQVLKGIVNTFKKKTL
jgi:hypothetical protein